MRKKELEGTCGRGRKKNKGTNPSINDNTNFGNSENIIKPINIKNRPIGLISEAGLLLCNPLTAHADKHVARDNEDEQYPHEPVNAVFLFDAAA